MKRLLLPFLTVLALPSAVYAESYWLVLFAGKSNKAHWGVEKIEMPNLKQCEMQGKIFLEKGIGQKNKYICITGK